MKSLIPAIVGAMIVLADPAIATESSVPFILADQVHAERITGWPTIVALIDSGIDLGDPGLSGSIVPGDSIVHGVYFHDAGADIYGHGHGTYMSLIITDATGVAPDAGVMPVRVFDSSGQAHLGDIRAAIWYTRWQRRSLPNIRVINLSLGTGEQYGCPCDAADRYTADMAGQVSSALAEGIITFAATGNFAVCGAMDAPGCISDVVKVAASYDDDYGSVDFGPPADCWDMSTMPYYIACFSNIAENCDWLLAAPRVRHQRG